MNKALVVPMLAAMILSASCGENTMEGVKKDTQEASQKIEQAAKDADEKLKIAKSEADAKWIEMRDQIHSKAIELSGVKPGMTLEEAVEILGEPVETVDDKLIFDNGVELEIDKDSNTVEELKGDTNAAGVQVGMPENSLKEMCGPADELEDKGGGNVEYIYYSTDKKSKVTYKAHDGIITEIVSSLND